MAIHVMYVMACAMVISCAFGDDDAFQALFQQEKDPLFVAGGSDMSGFYALYASSNGALWSGNLLSDTIVGTLISVVYGKERFISAGGPPNYYMSLDGLIWAGASAGPNTNIYDVVYAGGFFVAVGDEMTNGAVYASMDGLVWSGNLVSLPGVDLFGVAYGAGKFVAVGYDYTIYTSLDGLAWSENVGPGGGTGFIFSDVTYGNGAFVAVGDNNAVTVSKDGLVWLPVSYIAGGGMLADVAYGAGKFVAVGTDGTSSLATIYASTNGLVWSDNLYRGGSSLLVGVTYCRDRFVAVGSGGTVAYSFDGLAWQSQTIADNPVLTCVTCRQ